jgi:hypothetical protein
MDGGVIEGAALSSLLGTGAAEAGAATGLGGFGALNLAGSSASMLSPIAAGLGGSSFIPAALAETALGSGLTTAGALGQSIAPYAGDLANAGGYTAEIPTAATEGVAQPGDNFKIPKWIENMYTDKKTGEFDPLKAGMYGLGGMTLFNLMSGRGNNYMKPYQPPSAASYGLGRTLAPNYAPIRMADGGIASLNIGPSSVASKGVAPASLMQQQQDKNLTMGDLQGIAQQYGYSIPGMADGGIAGLSANPNFPTANQQNPRYAVPSQMPVGASDVRLAHLPPTSMASGGSADLGGYSDGGRMLKGPGDGMSDSIPASISGKQPARLADGEFVVPADVVSHLGNGSTDAGAKQLYSMMDKVRKARTGNPKQGKQINPKKYVPA